MAAPTRGKRKSPGRKSPRDTPAMRQYRRFKESHPDCVLFFRMGDFYEMFDEDAITAHQVLGLTLTERTEGIPMAGVPYHAADNYLQKMLAQGYRVAICDQIQDPKEAKGVVERAVTRVLTPGTLVDEHLLSDGAANCTALMLLRDDDAVIAVAELSTGRFELLTTHRRSVVDELARLSPAELLVCETHQDDPIVQRAVAVTGCALTPRPPWTLHAAEAERTLRAHWQVGTLQGWGLDDATDESTAAGALLGFLLETMPGSDAAGLRHLRPPQVRRDCGVLAMDASTLRQLEIERTMRTGGHEGSLLDVLQTCRTPMGRRLLRQWLCWPLTDRANIEARHEMVAAMLADGPLRNDLLETLGRIQDIARIAGRVSTGRVTPRDLVALGRSIGQLPALCERLELLPPAAGMHAAASDLQKRLGPLGEMILRSCRTDAPAHLREGGLFEDGIDEALDEARSLQRDGSQWLAEYQAHLASESGINSLKVGYNKVFGYYIEVTHSNTDKVPVEWTRRQTLRNAERYITQPLKEYETKATGALARGIEREQELFADLVDRCAAQTEALGEYSDMVASLDVLSTFAEQAATRKLTRPIMTNGHELQIDQGRHPVLDHRIGSDFVPNDCHTAHDQANTTNLLLITGPNMAGKSTYIRQVALIVLLAQAGSFVPADAATIGVVDRIFARIGASDELHTGMSTFMVEMTETANILHHATEQSLVILDEIGRGTSTLDGLSLAWAITEALAQRGCRTLFATHYHELTDLANRIDGVGNRHVAVQEWEDRIVFLHRIRPGGTDRSYGVHVGRLAGIPEAVLERARSILDSMEVHHAADGVPPTASPQEGSQMSLFMQTVDHPVVGKLRGLDLNQLTPLQAFDLLRTLHHEAQEHSEDD